MTTLIFVLLFSRQISSSNELNFISDIIFKPPNEYEKFIRSPSRKLIGMRVESQNLTLYFEKYEFFSGKNPFMNGFLDLRDWNSFELPNNIKIDMNYYITRVERLNIYGTQSSVCIYYKTQFHQCYGTEPVDFIGVPISSYNQNMFYSLNNSRIKDQFNRDIWTIKSASTYLQTPLHRSSSSSNIKDAEIDIQFGAFVTPEIIIFYNSINSTYYMLKCAEIPCYFTIDCLQSRNNILDFFFNESTIVLESFKNHLTYFVIIDFFLALFLYFLKKLFLKYCQNWNDRRIFRYRENIIPRTIPERVPEFYGFSKVSSSVSTTTKKSSK